jgi:hypothetical protein
VLRQVADLGAVHTDADFRALADKVVARYSLASFLIAVPGEILEQLIFAARQVAMVSATFVEEGSFQPQLDLLRDMAAQVVKEHTGHAVEYHVTSELALGRDMAHKAEADNGKMVLAAIAMVVAVLLIFFRSPVATGLILVMIQLSTYVSKALLCLMVREGIEMSPFTMPMMTFVMLGAGVDYSLILSERYQQERSLFQWHYRADRLWCDHPHPGQVHPGTRLWRHRGGPDGTGCSAYPHPCHLDDRRRRVLLAGKADGQGEGECHHEVPECVCPRCCSWY